ncbi:hypothetical protein POM88_039680 [Heracleum sosnowskyi]|uniref:Uncharacterized protein n=1 Tax=Heracleum sosnowskyi TaxID=360622 RepID=A0AAD8HBM9_9APIA|nr:hypothetical protein POM88_039680 [Heracleum sosnowskyi]
MLRFCLHLFLLLPQFFLMFNISSAVLCTPTDSILLNCGASYNTSSSDGREWDTDTACILKASKTSSAQSELTPPVDQIPYCLFSLLNLPIQSPSPKLVRNFSAFTFTLQTTPMALT